MSSKFYYKIYYENDIKILAICDYELENKIDIRFYKGDIIEEENIDEIFQEEYQAINALGENIIRYLLERFKFDEKLIGKYKDIPHVILFFI